ncbi:ABC transporter G family member 22-like isoform X2 [Nymphaea colorata]|uniref:ABC transporter G family member 22-like isoform X2 n=1 Tax=Nymphaea colorata TaxID=210225 RepID=UPI00129DBB62|nr:ABC transporter G family member 22-like isoform X2 [Nymphaea colorata]
MESRSGIPRTRSEQLEFSTARRSTDTENGAPYPTGARKSSLGRKIHIRKARSEQLKEELDALGIGTFAEESSMAALSRASSASMGFSFSLAGFTLPPEGMADLHGFPDENNNGDDLETGNSKKTATITEPTLPIFLKFWEVKYKVGVKGGGKGASEKEILKGITGSADPGEVLALMGPSGSGKTSLLNVLSGRVRQRNICGGSVTYNDLPFSKPLKSRCLDTIIGGSFVRGVSGGERKRVCIGNEILINPSLLFLDEPTSGLDSTTALRIIQVLHGIAEAGKTVITTIHQPSSRLFQKFDKLILLGRGNLLYFGKAKDATGYFSTVGCSPLIPMNPAEFLIDLANGNVTDITVPSELEDKVNTGSPRTETRNGKLSPCDVHDYLVEAFETRVADNEKKKLLKPSPIDDELKSKVLSKHREWGTSWAEQFSILFCRGLKERRHEYLSWMRVTQVFSTAIILGLLWWHSDVHTPKNLEDQAGLLFFIAVFWGFFPVFTAIFTFPQERAMLAKERSVDMYRLSAYFIARTSSDLPLDLILPVIFLGIVYFMAGLKLDVSAFFLTMVTVFLSIVAAEGLGLAIGATVMDIKKATTLASVTIMTFMLAGGFFVKKVPVFVSWVRYISFNYHTYKLLLRVQYGGIASSVNGVTIDNGAMEAGAMIAMVFLYRLLAYFSLRKMKLGNVS